MSTSNPLVNKTPINTIFKLNDVPWITYGMIAITTVALACVTMLDDSNKSFAKDDGFMNTLGTTTTSIVPEISNPFSKGSEKEASNEPEPEEKEPEQEQEPEPEEEPEPEPEEKEQEQEPEEKEPDEEEEEEEPPNKGGRQTKTNIRKYKHNKTKKTKQYRKYRKQN